MAMVMMARVRPEEQGGQPTAHHGPGGRPGVHINSAPGFNSQLVS